MTPSIAKGFRRFTLLSACTLAIAACTYGPDAGKGGDYRQNHPIKVGSEPVALTIALPVNGGRLSPGDKAKFHEFLRTFVSRAATAVSVETTQPDVARKTLLQNGLREGEFIVIESDAIKAPNAVMSFKAAKVVTPECGDFSSQSGFTGSNKLHANFGCSLQRNTGEMIDDPNRLITSSPRTGGSSSRIDAGIFTHQSGTVKPRLLDGN
ncbi:CpaD family pilus assembly lipoprotein [Magnetovibrio sp. PR-2]|uniref:CpaD family pilus assembly lipoprotein n=1 Tax=Magnetovibrio sp. PR-2 TaxID=3120356 RepID=UPI002FCE0D6A